MRGISLLTGLLWFLISSVVAHAVSIGYLYINRLAPEPGDLNTFSNKNLTRDSAHGGSVFPSNFSVLDSLTWMDSTLLLTVEVFDGPPEGIPLNMGSLANPPNFIVCPKRL